MPRLGAPLVLAFALALALLPPLAGAQVIPTPVHEEGDRWLYLTPGGGRIEVYVGAEQDVELRNVTYRVRPFSSIERDANDTIVERSSIWRNVTDGGILREHVEPAGGLNVTRTYDEPCRDMRFPLRAQADWRVSCDGVTERGERFALRYDVTVRAIEDVTVPAGKFPTMRVVRDLPSGDVREQWSTDACSYVRKETSAGTIQLASYVCAKPQTSDALAPDEPTKGIPPPTVAATLILVALAAVARRNGQTRAPRSRR